jgi:hypothetical protein
VAEAELELAENAHDRKKAKLQADRCTPEEVEEKDTRLQLLCREMPFSAPKPCVERGHSACSQYCSNI